MPGLPFTDYSVQKVSCLDKAQVRYMCTQLPGFGILVGKRRKTFFVITGRDRKLETLGHYPALTLKEARKKALAVIYGDPKRNDSQTASLRIKEYILQLNRSQRYRYEQQRLLNKHLLPYVTDLTKYAKSDILAILDALKHTPSEQLHTFRAIRAFLNWCAERDYITVSPAASLSSPGSDNTRDVILTDSQLTAVWCRAANMGEYGLVMRLCILLGTRKGETGAVQPAWVTERLTIPKEFTKNGREHVMPLSEAAKPYATQLATGPKPNWNSWNKIKKQAGFTWLRLHDIRRTFATTLAELGVAPHIIERCLNHVSQGEISPLARIYNRYRYEKEIKEALALYEKHLERLIGQPLL